MKLLKISSKSKSPVFTMVDDSLYSRLNTFNWYLTSNGYVVRDKYLGNKKSKKIRLHRYIIDAPEDMEVDHIDGNPLNNQRNNLRLCHRYENARNVKKHIDNTAPYKCVWKEKRNLNKPWRARITVNYRYVNLGYFKTAEDAYDAYKQASLKYHGIFGRT